MSLIIEIFGSGKDLTVLQMSARGILIFFITLGFIRISGRRSFGMHMPFDNVITITLGALLSRAIVGVSPFLPVVGSSLMIVVVHRAIGWLLVRNPRLARWMEGEKILLFNGQKLDENAMNKALVCREDVLQGVRKTALTEDLSSLEKVFIERNGEITSLRKPI